MIHNYSVFTCTYEYLPQRECATKKTLNQFSITTTTRWSTHRLTVATSSISDGVASLFHIEEWGSVFSLSMVITTCPRGCQWTGRWYTWRGPQSRTWDLWLMFCCVRLKVLMQCRVFFISCEETSFLRVILVPLQHFLINETLHQVDSTEQKIREDNCYVQYFEDYVNTVVNLHKSTTEIEVK